MFIIGRDRNRPALERLGCVEVLARGSAVRFDRTYALFRITPAGPDEGLVDSLEPLADAGRPAARR
jgi:hypothetical protein